MRLARARPCDLKTTVSLTCANEISRLLDPPSWQAGLQEYHLQRQTDQEVRMDTLSCCRRSLSAHHVVERCSASSCPQLFRIVRRTCVSNTTRGPSRTVSQHQRHCEQANAPDYSHSPYLDLTVWCLRQELVTLGFHPHPRRPGPQSPRTPRRNLAVDERRIQVDRFCVPPEFKGESSFLVFPVDTGLRPPRQTLVHSPPTQTRFESIWTSSGHRVLDCFKITH